MTVYTILGFVFSVYLFGAAFGWFSDKSTKIKTDEFNRNLRKQLDEEKSTLAEQAQELHQREQYIRNLRQEFDSSFLQGRKWLSSFIAEADRAFDESTVRYLRIKKHPAPIAADTVAEAKAERRLYKERVKFLEYQLESLREYFPFLEEYEDAILDETIPLGAGEDNLAALEEADPILRFITKSEYLQLPITQRNQIALDRYINRNHSPVAIGRIYERYLGYLYESAGWQVEYHGIIKGYEDLGRDLICIKGNEVKIVQAKCWSRNKTIHEKHIFQLYGTLQLYLMGRSSQEGLFPTEVSASFETTTVLSSVARDAAKWLKIDVKECQSLKMDFPMIKCNINQTTKEKIYHLPFDQQYDRTKIIPSLGEMYATRVEEAERNNFRRAFRHTGPFT